MTGHVRFYYKLVMISSNEDSINIGSPTHILQKWDHIFG